MARKSASKPNCVRQFVFDRRIRTQSEFDELHQEDIENVVADIGRTYSVFNLIILKSNGQFSQLELYFDKLSLLNEGLSLLVSGLGLVRQRARLEAMALLRVAVEAACVAVHIAFDSDAYARYSGQIAKRYDSGAAITFAKPHIHRVGEFWGGLSRAIVHPNRIGFGPRIANDGALSINIGESSADSTQDLLSLAMVSIASLMVFRAAELALFEPDLSQPDMLRLVGNNLRTWPTADRLLKDRFDRLDELTAFSSQARRPRGPDGGATSSVEGKSMP
jgi:hypothetical protein